MKNNTNLLLTVGGIVLLKKSLDSYKDDLNKTYEARLEKTKEELSKSVQSQIASGTNEAIEKLSEKAGEVVRESFDDAQRLLENPTVQDWGLSVGPLICPANPLYSSLADAK